MKKLKLKINLNKKNILLIIITILLIFLFFAFKIIYTPDSCQYYYLSLIIKGVVPFKEWILVRGPLFPLIIAVITTLFGDNILGFKIGLCIIYLLTIFFGYFILNKFLKQNTVKLEKIVIYFMYILFIIFNPIILGYSHVLLTEMVMPLILLISIIMSDKLSHLTFTKNKFKYILFSLYFMIMFVVTWFIKQPYLPVIFSTLFIPNLLEWFKNKSISNFSQKMITLIFCFLFLFLTLKIWNNKLTQYSFDTSINNFESTSSLLSGTILRSINNNYRIQSVDDKIDIINKDKFLSKKDIKKIKQLIDEEKNNNFEIFKEYDIKDNHTNTYVIYTDGGVTTKQALNFYFDKLSKNPILVLDSYYRSYMSTLDLFERKVEGYYVTKRLNYKSYIAEKWLFQNEIRDYGLYIFDANRSNIWWISKDIIDQSFIERYPAINYMEHLKEKDHLSENVSKSILKISVPYLILFIVSYLVLPIVLIYAFIRYLKTKYNYKYFYITSLLGVAYFNLIAHVLMGTILDRYIYPGYILVLLGYIMLLLEIKNINKN